MKQTQKTETFFLKTHKNFYDKYGRDMDFICRNGFNKDVAKRYSKKYNAETLLFISFLGLWQQNKQVFQFSDELKDEIFTSASSLDDIPGEVMERIPYNSFYVQAPFNGYDGFFVCRNEKTGILDILLIGNLLGRYRCMPYIVNTSMKVKELVRAITKEQFDLTQKKKINSNDVELITTNSFSYAELSGELKKVLSLLLYICSENADIRPVEKVKTEKTKKSRKEDINVNAVGNETAVIIRHIHQMKRQYETYSTGTGRKKTAHIRRAHWHHYWTGSGKEKRLIVKWISPMFINKEDIPAVVINKF